jgi:hypothetical protein
VSTRGTLALVLGLVLGFGAGPVHAQAPAPDVDDTAVEPAPEAEADPGIEPITEADPGEGVDAPEPATDEPTTAPEPATDEPSAPAPAPEPATHDVPADDFEAESGLAPGGYYGHGVILERPPPDGRNRIIVGSILVPLGTIAVISSAVGTWMTVPAHCSERLGATGIEATAAKCQGLFTFNVIRTSYGGLMLVSGATILALGMIQRERYRKWRHEHGMRARVEPTLDLAGRGASLGLRLRF